MTSFSDYGEGTKQKGRAFDISMVRIPPRGCLQAAQRLPRIKHEGQSRFWIRLRKMYGARSSPRMQYNGTISRYGKPITTMIGIYNSWRTPKHWPSSGCGVATTRPDDQVVCFFEAQIPFLGSPYNSTWRV